MVAPSTKRKTFPICQSDVWMNLTVIDPFPPGPKARPELQS